MPYVLRKLLRDLGVTLLGVALLFAGSHAVEVAPDLGVAEATASMVAVLSLAAYRQLREVNPDLFDLDEPGV